MRGLSLVVASGGHSSSRCAGLSLSRPLLLRSTGSKRTGSVLVAHGPSCSAACGIFPDQGSNPCPLHWQADSQPLRHQGSPSKSFIHCSFFSMLEFAVGSFFIVCFSAEISYLFIYYKLLFRDFPGGPAVKTLSFHCRGHGFDPWSGN